MLCSKHAPPARGPEHASETRRVTEQRPRTVQWHLPQIFGVLRHDDVDATSDRETAQSTPIYVRNQVCRWHIILRQGRAACLLIRRGHLEHPAANVQYHPRPDIRRLWHRLMERTCGGT